MKKQTYHLHHLIALVAVLCLVTSDAQAWNFKKLLESWGVLGRESADDVARAATRGAAIPIGREGTENVFRIGPSGAADLVPVPNQRLSHGTLDISTRVAQRSVDYVYSRIEILQALFNRLKSDQPYVFLKGKSGVGKTNVLEMAAHRINRNDADFLGLATGTAQDLRGNRMLQLNRLEFQDANGAFNSRFDEMLEELARGRTAHGKDYEKTILVFDNVEHWMSKGDQEQVAAFANRINAMRELGFKIVLTGDENDYAKLVQQTVLRTFFREIAVEAVTHEEALSILKMRMPTLIKRYGNIFSDSILEKAVRMADQKLPGLGLPGSAIRLLETAGSQTLDRYIGTPNKQKYLQAKAALMDRIEGLKNRRGPGFFLRRLEHQKELLDLQKVALDQLNKQLENTEELRTSLATLLTQRHQLESQLAGLNPRTVEYQDLAARIELKSDEISSIVSQINIDAPSINLRTELSLDALIEALDTISPTAVDRTALRNSFGNGLEYGDLLEKVTGRVIGQTSAIRDIVKYLERALRFHISGPEAVVALFGPSRLGKTYLAEVVGKILGRPVRIIPGGELSTETAVNALLGADPGYVGHESGGLLARIFRKDPNPILILDEFEKVHPEGQKILYQMLAKNDPHINDKRFGRIDTNGVQVYITSNLLTGPNDPFFQRALQSGAMTEEQVLHFFDELRHIEDPGARNTWIRDTLIQLKHANGLPVFEPAVLNRINVMVRFAEFSASEMVSIFRLDLKEFQESFLQRNIGLHVSGPTAELLGQHAATIDRSATPIKGVIENFISGKILKLQGEGLVKEGDEIFVSLKNFERAGSKLTDEEIIRMIREMAEELEPDEIQSLIEFRVVTQGEDGRFWVRPHSFIDSSADTVTSQPRYLINGIDPFVDESTEAAFNVIEKAPPNGMANWQGISSETLVRIGAAPIDALEAFENAVYFRNF